VKGLPASLQVDQQLTENMCYMYVMSDVLKLKVKLSQCFNWEPRHEGVLGSGGIAPHILWPRHWMVVSGQLHGPVALPPGKETLVPIG
jgi:hypothetical protein